MKNQDEILLDQATEAMRAVKPSADDLAVSADKVAKRLGIVFAASADAVESCDDMRPLLDSYRAGTLPVTRALLVEAHLRECAVCYRRLRTGSGAVNWSVPKVVPIRPRIRPLAMAWAMAASLAVAAAGLFVYQAYWQVPPGVRAEVQSIDGSASLITDSGDRLLAPGAQLHDGDILRTSGGSHAVVRLADGSTVEMNERSALGFQARGHNATLDLDRGAVIVKAMHRKSGHLYVQTEDCRVAVTGTVFSVDSGIKGSRIGVLQGAVEVRHSGVRSMVHAGDMFSTTENLAPEPLTEQVAWSPNRNEYLELLAQFSMLQHKIEQIPMPQPRYGSDLLNRVPADTQLYVSVPNLGDFVTQAKSIFDDQLKQSPVLQKWWNTGRQDKTAQLDELVNKVHDMSQYIGDEMVIVALKQQTGPGFAVVADVQRQGLAALLKQEFAKEGHEGLTVLDENGLNSTATGGHGGYALVREKEVIFSNSIETLKTIDAQLNAGASGFATGDFGQQIAAAYNRGAGIILAANLQRMMEEAGVHGGKHASAFMQESGVSGVRYLIAEHRQTNNGIDNHLNLQFSGSRQRVASWLGAPAPVGSLDFVSPNAALVVAGVTKEPASILDDMMAMMAGNDHKTDEFNKAQAELGIDIRNDLAANLGGEFTFALDGPVLPTPSWKIVAEVKDSARFQSTLERLVQAAGTHFQSKDKHGIAISSTQSGGQTFFEVRDPGTGAQVAEYTYASGYMILAPTRALLMEAMQAHTSGNTLAHSSSFKALLPVDQNENYSAVAYQNLGPVLTPLLSQMSGSSADAIRKLAADSHPTAICAWGKDSRIEAASNSNMFGFDFLTLGQILKAEKQGQLSSTELKQ
ncbi:FecR domain-containing protein [Occallatibacter savannae]|uniref:FecR domain-containing protein n=1 Tax=Occallatibacter savannae TaxID=1002691 RepID=UPI000D6926FA|nr:FecR domain-containing protein [Occallatibacter savannae]